MYHIYNIFVWYGGCQYGYDHDERVGAFKMWLYKKTFWICCTDRVAIKNHWKSWETELDTT